VGALTTLFAENNGFAGNMFDLVASQAVNITGFEVNLENVNNPASTATIQVWYRLGSVAGNQDSPAGWILLGTDQVVSNGIDVPTPVNVGGLRLEPGQV